MIHRSDPMIGNHRIHLDKINSTQLYAEELLSNSRPSQGTVITTDFQMQGMGQSGRGWYSSSGQNLLLTLMYYPENYPITKIWHYNAAIAIALCEVINESISDGSVKIKWPNDIYINDKKVAGILIKSKIVKKLIDYLIIGIGLNVNETTFPKEIPNPISLAQASKKWVSKDHIFDLLMEKINFYFQKLCENREDELQEIYHKNLYCLEEKRQFFTKTKGKFEGVIKGVTKDGELKMETQAGMMMFRQNELSYLFSKTEP